MPDAFTKLLLHCNGADGSILFPDSSLSNHIVTRQGDAQVDTAFKKFDTGSLLCDGNGDYLTVPDHVDWDFGTNNFTIDFWVRVNAFEALDAPFSHYENGNFEFWIYHEGGGNGWNIGCDIDGVNIFVMDEGSTNIVVDTWYHFALVRNGTTFSFYKDGTLLMSQADRAGSITGITADLTIGTYATHYWNGWIDEFRISKGIARWTENFDVPTEEYNGIINALFFGANF